MINRSVVSVRMGGQEYRIRSDEDPEWLQRVAAHVDESMERIRSRTDTVDSLAIAMLAALNIARELMELREAQEGRGPAGEVIAEAERVRALTELAESAAAEASA